MLYTWDALSRLPDSDGITFITFILKMQVWGVQNRLRHEKSSYENVNIFESTKCIILSAWIKIEFI